MKQPKIKNCHFCGGKAEFCAVNGGFSQIGSIWKRKSYPRLEQKGYFLAVM